MNSILSISKELMKWVHSYQKKVEVMHRVVMLITSENTHYASLKLQLLWSFSGQVNKLSPAPETGIAL